MTLLPPPLTHELPEDEGNNVHADDEDGEEDEEDEDDLNSVFNSPVHEQATTPAASADLLIHDHPQLPTVEPIDPSVLGAIGFNVEITPPPDSAHVTCELPDVVPRGIMGPEPAQGPGAAGTNSVSSDGGG